MLECSIKEWRDCEYGSVSGSLGFAGIGFEGHLSAAKVELTALSVSVEGKVTATVSDIKTSAELKATLVKGDLELSSVQLKGEIACSGSTSGHRCSGTGVATTDAPGFDMSSNGTIGAELRLGIGKIGGEWNAWESSIAMAGSTVELLTTVAKKVWATATGHPAE